MDLSCYGPDLERLADLVGDFDLLSQASTHSWQAIEWRMVAEALGCSQPFARALEQSDAPGPAAVEAFTTMMARRPPAMTEGHARAQASVLQQIGAQGRERSELWRVTVDPTDLPGGACYEEAGQMLRAFQADTSPGYFGDGWPGPRPRAESACGWQTPLVLHLGTFPWVYGARLGGEGPGLRWTSRMTLPAVEGLKRMASLLDPEGNLRQDARQVAAIYADFRAHTAPLLARVPMYHPGTLEVGRLYRREGLLAVHQGSLDLAGLDGPRGRLAASAYNYCLRRFACFFAVRRATLRALPSLPSLAALALASRDSCLVEHARWRLARAAAARGRRA